MVGPSRSPIAPPSALLRRARGAARLAVAVAVCAAWPGPAGCSAPDTSSPSDAASSTADADTSADAAGDGPSLDVPDSPEGLRAALAERLCAWEPHAGNPLIEPPNAEFLIGDPTVVIPDEAPDGRWHLFANSVLGIHHYLSDDGVAWEREPRSLFSPGAFRAYVFRHGGAWNLVFEQFLALDRSEIRISRSDDLFAWSAPATLLEPELAWEQTVQPTVGNPYVQLRDDGVWLYYSADGVFQEDTGFAEPRVIGLARAPGLDGPWTRESEPILGPDPSDPWANRGAGSIKLLDEEMLGARIALNNGIYATPAEGSGALLSGSAIAVRYSLDGIAWHDVCGGPILAPDGEGWDADFVYAFDTVRVGDTIRLYYNAREGRAEGVERIGMATLELPADR